MGTNYDSRIDLLCRNNYESNQQDAII